MTVRKRVRSALLVAAVASLATVLGAATALAAATLTVKVTHGGSILASSSNTKLADNGVSVTCTSSKASGTIPNGTTKGTSPVSIGTFHTLSFSGCTGPLGAVTVTIKRLPIGFKVNSRTMNGLTDVIITGIDASVGMTGCSFTATGSVPGFFNNSTHILTLTPKLPFPPLAKAQLTISGVSGCAGLVSNGDHPIYTAKYKLDNLVIKST